MLVALVTACQFRSDDEFFKDIPLPNQEGIDILLQDVTEVEISDISDTVSFFKRTRLKINIDLGGRQAIQGTTTINGVEVTSNVTSLGSISITIEPRNWGTGFHQLNLKMITTTGSGSLADISRQEFFEVERSWVLHIDIDPPHELEVQSIGFDNDFIRISWPRYDRINFQEYRIGKYCYTAEQPDQLSYCKEWRIADQNVTSLLDTGHLQGNVAYIIRTKAAYQFSTGVQSEEFEVPSKFGFWIEGREDGSHDLAWSKPFLEKGFFSYKLDNGRYSNDHIQWVYNLNDTTYQHDSQLHFGNLITYNVSTYGINQGASRILQTKTVPIGVEIPAFSFLDTSPHHESLYFNIDMPDEENRRLVRADLNSVTRSDSISYSDLSGMDNSSSHELIVSSDGLRLFVMNKLLLHELNPTTLSVINTFDLSELGGTDSEITPESGEVSGNGLLKIHVNSAVYLYNLSSRSVVSQINYGSHEGSLSPNGQWLIVRRSVFKWQNGTFELHGVVDDTPAYSVGFMSNGSQYFKYTNVKTIEIVDLETGAVIESLPLSNESLFGREMVFRFDKVSGQYYTPRPSRIKDLIYKFSAVDKNIQTLRVADINSPLFFMAGDRVFNVSGAYKKFQ